MGSARRLSVLLATAALLLAACSNSAFESSVRPVTIPERTPRAAATTSTTTEVPAATARVISLPELSVWAFPGPNHYEGDVLTFQVPVGGFGKYSLVEATITVDGTELATEGLLAGDPLLGDVVVFPDGFDTSGAVGGHWVRVTAELTPELSIDVTQRFVVTPASGRPHQELDTGWTVERTECCNVTYLEKSAAARDIEGLVAIIDESADAVEAHFGLELPQVDFVLIDKLWGNGGYAGREVVVSYLDRDFSPGRQKTFRQTVLHELAHAVTDQIEVGVPWPLIEGVAVQFTGGHFKPEPLGSRARALADAGKLPALDFLFDNFSDMQHETRYAAVGAFTEFLVSEYGLDQLIDLYGAKAGGAGSGWLDRAAARILGDDLATLQAGFDRWVASFSPLTQALDVELTVALQEARRSFQAAFNPYPNYFIYPSVTATGQAALAMRDASTPGLVAVEALIAYAQDLIIAGDLDAAASVVTEIERIVAEGTIGPGLSGEFLAIAEAIDAEGLELVEYVPGNAAPTAVATGDAPDLSLVELVSQEGQWVVVAVRPAPDSAGALGQ